jgi:hypothetical protein
MVLTVSFVLSLVSRACCHHRQCDAKHRHQLDISVGISGPHDFAVRFQLARLARHKRPPHPVPNVRDDRETPLSWARDAAESAGDLGRRSIADACDRLARRANQSTLAKSCQVTSNCFAFVIARSESDEAIHPSVIRTLTVSRTRCGAISAFTRVFDALWRCSAEPGPMRTR